MPTNPPTELHNLIDRFQRNQDAYRAGTYNETMVRREFIDPFLTLLGWDVDNKKGYAEAYKDVVHEDAIRIGRSTKAPDYSLRIGGQRKLFVEAKKPAINIKQDVAPAYQVRRYAWSAKLPLSILTDFEEFAVYDCTGRPDPQDDASHGRILYWRYEQYPEKWDELLNLFSPEAIMRGSFDQFAQSSKRKRGTAEVDNAFLQEISQWREELARNIALRNPGIKTHDLNDAVQTTIDRLIFLRIAEDRGIEPYERLREAAAKSDIYAELGRLFQLADAKYNSGLFHFKAEKGRDEAPDSFTLGLSIDDKVLKTIIKRLYYPDSPYQFDMIPADILGQVYEQFLGKVIRLTAGGQAKVEEKPEVKKAGGVFYTPTYIVEYIVRQTVGQLLVDKKPGAKGDAAKLRLLDPACGSGSFLIGAYQYLLDWYLDAYLPEAAQWARSKEPPIYQNERGEWKLTIGERKRILLANIYGVDIDPQAVEVTKLSLLLKVMEGETEATLGTQLRLLPERVLPDLSANIKCGNSLIGPDFYDNRQLSLGLLDEEEMYRINVFDWAAAFPAIVPWGGFDAVIGNPPYGAYLSQTDTSYLLSRFRLQNYQLDTYFLFLEQALTLLASKGLLGFIIPNTWLLNLSAQEIRRHVFRETQIENIVHYGRAVFAKVTVDTEIVILKRTNPSATHNIQIEVVKKDRSSENYAISQAKWQAGDGAAVNLFERPEYVMLAYKLKQHTILDKVCKITQGSKPFQVGKGKPPQTRETVDTKPFVAETAKDSTFRPLLRGSLIQRYQIIWNHNYYISLGDWLAEPRYSASYDAPAKIVIRQTGDSLVATLDRQQFVVRDNLYTIVPRDSSIDLQYVLGLINSRLLHWFYQNIINPEAGEALAQVKRGHLAELPIVVPQNRDQHNQLVQLVEQLLNGYQRLTAAHTAHEKTLLQRQITATDAHIDQLVYQLYDLTDAEIAIVENQT